MKNIIDSCVWVALFNADDVFHKKAVELFETIEGLVFLPEIIICEVTGVLQRKIGKHAASQFSMVVMNTKNIALLTFPEETVQRHICFYQKDPPDDLSYADAVLLFLSSEYQVLTFDRLLQNAIQNQ